MNTLNLGKFPAWAGPNDTWSWQDDYFETWLQAMAQKRREQVLTEALGQRRGPEPKPQPHPRPTPRPAPSTPRPRIRPMTETFTDQQMTKGAEILARIERNKETA